MPPHPVAGHQKNKAKISLVFVFARAVGVEWNTIEQEILRWKYIFQTIAIT